MPTDNNNNKNNKGMRPSTPGSRASTTTPKTKASSAQGTGARQSSAQGNRSTSTPASRQKRARSKEAAAKAEGVASSCEEDSSEDDSESDSDSSSSSSSSSSSLAEGEQPSGKYKTRKPATVEEKWEMVAEVAALSKTAGGALDLQSLKEHFEWFEQRSVTAGGSLKGFIVYYSHKSAFFPLPSPDVLQEIEEEMHQLTHPHPRKKESEKGVRVVLVKEEFWPLFHERGYYGGQHNINAMFLETYGETWSKESWGGSTTTLPHCLPTPDPRPTYWMTAGPFPQAHVPIELSSSSSSAASPLRSSHSQLLEDDSGAAGAGAADDQQASSATKESSTHLAPPQSRPQPGAEPLPAQDAGLAVHSSAVELQKQLDAVRGELASKKEELTETKTHHAQEIAQLKSDFTQGAEKERTQLQDFIAAQRVELDTAQKSVVELKQQLNDLRDTHAKDTAIYELNTEAMQKELMDTQLQLASTEGKRTALVEQVKQKSAELTRSIHQAQQDFQEERQTLEEKAAAEIAQLKSDFDKDRTQVQDALNTAQKSVVELAAAAAQEITLLRTQKDQVQAQKDQLDAAFIVDREGIMNANNAAFAQMAARHQAELAAASAASDQELRGVVQEWRQFVLQLHPATLQQAQRNLLNVQ